ncbi:hypothetical protein RHGRI_021369 [Rhododendron griersonianum]|uniref:F-actin-capping protein subunit alpha n=1 Tax=Rhododendron griersonianum TaxID=479676 RepID=A0AAV6JPK1_9ERIC|nr:hypothetical protein RHGRI_021369 [Rhododendron griersonianum]
MLNNSRGRVAEEDGNQEEAELSEKQKKEIAKWFLLNAPAGEIQYVAKDENEYIEPRTAQVARVDHVKQVCTEVRPATDEELPSPYVEDYRCALDVEIMKYVGEAYPKAARHSPQNFCNGSWRSIWNVEFKDDVQIVEVRGRMQVGAHYFEEGNVQLDAKHEFQDSTLFQSPNDLAVSLTNIIRHHETEYLASLQITVVSSACFEQRTVDQTPLPLLFMRTVIQAIDAFPSMVDFVMEILSKLVNISITDLENATIMGWDRWVSKMCHTTTFFSSPVTVTSTTA